MSAPILWPHIFVPRHVADLTDGMVCPPSRPDSDRGCSFHTRGRQAKMVLGIFAIPGRFGRWPHSRDRPALFNDIRCPKYYSE